ncbi:hypothetical protein [Aulosira sp. FACHB-615]|uniref:hypothetical protein n=1 Tax=Aulosira sp. FACHB-615 TaxID=2692777 RepID=UPI001682422B|nr:hypothetical protein [Aulosira sp. FACHB-615]MBD2489432.1 hypothetical protein [Aulosira sp. FACHB-615]
MAEPTLQEVFGANAIQDANTITIYKSDLPGLTPQENNTAESLLTGINVKAKQALTQSNFDENLDQSVFIERGFSNFTFRGPNQDSYRVDVLTINLAKPDDSDEIDPDNY